jgi:hypothetical protein
MEQVQQLTAIRPSTGESDVICEAYDGTKPNHTPCRVPATTWIDISSLARLIAVCDHHTEEWKKYASREYPEGWSLYPMR